MGTVTLKFQKAGTKIEVYVPVSALHVELSAKLRLPTGQREDNFNFAYSHLDTESLKNPVVVKSSIENCP